MSNFRHPNWKLSDRMLSWAWTVQNVFSKRPTTLTRSCVNVHGDSPGLPTTNENGKNHRLGQSTVEGTFHLFKKLKDPVYKKKSETSLRGHNVCVPVKHKVSEVNFCRIFNSLLNAAIIEKCSWNKSQGEREILVWMNQCPLIAAVIFLFRRYSREKNQQN